MEKRLALILACGLWIAACGSSSNNETKNASKGYSQALAFSYCMCAHGVSNFADPSSSRGAPSYLSARIRASTQKARRSS
jgi:hypothetical protein